VRHFAKQHGVPLGDFIPEWDLIFDPHAKPGTDRVDIANRTVNLFEPTSFMRAKPKRVTTVPPQINKVITHALGGDAAIVDHFINWLAVIVQHKVRTLTAWVLHGAEGTGKGTIMHRIIRPMLGEKHTAIRHMDELNQPYNHWMENRFVIFIDEIEAKALNNERGVAAKLRNFITEPTISIRAMHQGSRDVDNFGNWIFGSNMPEPVVPERARPALQHRGLPAAAPGHGREGNAQDRLGAAAVPRLPLHVRSRHRARRDGAGHGRSQDPDRHLGDQHRRRGLARAGRRPRVLHRPAAERRLVQAQRAPEPRRSRTTRKSCCAWSTAPRRTPRILASATSRATSCTPCSSTRSARCRTRRTSSRRCSSTTAST
jgi:hypothetical protein